jgi:hypothetical protein
MGCKPSSLRQNLFSVNRSRGRLRKKLYRQGLSDTSRSNPPTLRSITRMHATGTPTSIRSITGFWHFNNRSMEKNELRVVNCIRPQTPASIKGRQNCDNRPVRDDINIVDSNVEPCPTKGDPVGFREKELASPMPKGRKNEITPLIDPPSDLESLYRRNLKDGPERHDIPWHLREARSLTSILRALPC